jgi:hypothetical protein
MSLPHILQHLPPRQIEKISRIATIDLTIVQRKICYLASIRMPHSSKNLTSQ